MENLDIRILVNEAGITYKGIADQMGISRVYLSRIMAKPLSKDHRKRILYAIARIRRQAELGDG